MKEQAYLCTCGCSFYESDMETRETVPYINYGNGNIQEHEHECLCPACHTNSYDEADTCEDCGEIGLNYPRRDKKTYCWDCFALFLVDKYENHIQNIIINDLVSAGSDLDAATERAKTAIKKYFREEL